MRLLHHTLKSPGDLVCQSQAKVSFTVVRGKRSINKEKLLKLPTGCNFKVGKGQLLKAFKLEENKWELVHDDRVRHQSVYPEFMLFFCPLRQHFADCAGSATDSGQSTPLQRMSNAARPRLRGRVRSASVCSLPHSFTAPTPLILRRILTSLIQGGWPSLLLADPTRNDQSFHEC